jgi:hypothetical protein
MNRRLAALVLAGVMVSVATGASAQRGWTMLGQRAVTDRADHDVIAVSSERGTFKQIKLTVQRASVDFRRVVVHFGNGDKQELEMKNTIRAGGETRAIDIDGTDRVIKSVEFWYDANTRRGRQATVRLLGKH